MNSCCRTDQKNKDQSNYLKLPAPINHSWSSSFTTPLLKPNPLPQSVTINKTKAPRPHRNNRSNSIFRPFLSRQSLSCGLQIQQEKTHPTHHERRNQQSWRPNISPSSSSTPSQFHQKPNVPAFVTIRRRALPFRPVRHGITSNVSQYSDETMLLPKQVIVIHSFANNGSSSVLPAKTWIIRLGSSGFDNATQSFFVTIEEVWDGSICVAGPLTLRLHVNGWCNEIEVQPNVILSLHTLSYSLDKNGSNKSTMTTHFSLMNNKPTLNNATVQLELVHLL